MSPHTHRLGYADLPDWLKERCVEVLGEEFGERMKEDDATSLAHIATDLGAFRRDFEAERDESERNVVMCDALLGELETFAASFGPIVDMRERATAIEHLVVEVFGKYAPGLLSSTNRGGGIEDMLSKAMAAGSVEEALGRITQNPRDASDRLIAKSTTEELRILRARFDDAPDVQARIDAELSNRAAAGIDEQLANPTSTPENGGDVNVNR
jgi:hypothetical protein